MLNAWNTKAQTLPGTRNMNTNEKHFYFFKRIASQKHMHTYGIICHKVILNYVRLD